MAGALVLTAQPNIKGRVLADGKPLQGVLVSDGVNIVVTDASGRYEIESRKETGMVYITTPSGYVAETIDGIRPGFWQTLHLPVEQEEMHDFKLKSEDQSKYTVLFAADLHLSNDPDRDDLTLFREKTMPLVRRETEAAASAGPVYTVSLGDFTHDIYWYRFNFNEADGLRLLQDLDYPTPVYSVMGNHDHDGAIIGEDVDRRSAWIQNDCWGPAAYSVNIGSDCWIFMDDLIYVNVPGKGKKSKGIKGDRSYQNAFTEAQMAWLEKYLEYVPVDSQVYLCVHCPILKGYGGSVGILLPEEQVSKLDSMMARFGNPLVIFSGHIHKFDFCENPAYPNLVQRSLPATSGIMWGTHKGWPLVSGDGSDAGMLVGSFDAASEPSYRFSTYEFGDKYYRVYDMNEVAKFYATSPEIKEQKALLPKRLDYARKEYRNMIFVNYWAWKPGDVVELFENGKPLKVEMNRSEDPVHTLSYDIPRMQSNPKQKSACDHMFEAKTRSSKSTVTLRITDRLGNVLHEETIVRPISFDPSKL